MNEKLCNVAVAVPLRTTFTYRAPERLAAEIEPGSRVLVPFRKKSLVGVVTEWVEEAPSDAKLRDVQKCLDLVPALTPKLLELGKWVASYYVAPIGEVYRAMLPPLTELRAQQIVVLTDTGRRAPANFFAESATKPDFLNTLRDAKDGLSLQAATRSGTTLADLVRLQRRGLLEIRQHIQNRKRRTQRIIAWKSSQADGGVVPEKEERL